MSGRTRRAYAVVVVMIADDGTQSVSVAASYYDYRRAADLSERLTRKAEARIYDGADVTVHTVAISRPTIKDML